MKLKKSLCALASMLCLFTVSAQSDSEEISVDNPYSVKEVLNGTTSPRHYNNHFTITPPEGFVLIDEENSKIFLVDICGNPEASADGVLGCLIPNVSNIYEDPIPYFFVIVDVMCGYIIDDDASTFNYDELLEEMQKGCKDENDKYRKTHPEYPKVRLDGWAETPYYDKDTHTLYWGRLFDYQGEEKVVNYDMRVLGKDGFVMISAVGDESDLAELKSVGQQMLGNVVFDSGYTYNDFDESKDSFAEWTIGGLIAGNILTKAGFWAFLAKGWKLLLIAIVAIGAMFKKIFRRKTEDRESGTMSDDNQ